MSLKEVRAEMNPARRESTRGPKVVIGPPASVDLGRLTGMAQMIGVPVYRADPNTGELLRIA